MFRYNVNNLMTENFLSLIIIENIQIKSYTYLYTRMYRDIVEQHDLFKNV